MTIGRYFLLLIICINLEELKRKLDAGSMKEIFLDIARKLRLI
jgi:hypothetical protein